MRSFPFFAIAALSLTFGACSSDAQTLPSGSNILPSEEKQETSLYVVDVYDPERNPEADLIQAITQAQSSGKRILLEVGGEWCSWCHALDRYIQENETVASRLGQDFLIVKVNYSEENRNESFLSRYPEIPGYPHVFVLDSDGTFLHSQGTAALEEGKSYSEEAFLAFLTEWALPRG